MPVFPLRVNHPPPVENEDLRLWQEEVSDVLGAFAQNIRTVTADTTATTSDRTILCDAASNTITVTLPPAADVVSFLLYIKKIDATNDVTIDPSGTETIDKGTTVVLTAQEESLTLHSDGTEWWIL